jgi:uncharacterized protein (TIGR02145 family)
MKKTFLLFAMACFVFAGVLAQNGEIANLQVAQRTDGSGLVDIHFDLNGAGASYNLQFEASFDDGVNYEPLSVTFLTGELNEVLPGTAKHIIWAGKASHPETFSTQTRVRVIAIESTQSSDQINVTIRVDMSDETVSLFGVHIAGNFQGWDPGATELTDTGNLIYEITLTFPEGEYLEYKFINGNDWGMEETVLGPCVVPPDNNRFLTVPGENTVLEAVCFGSCVICNPGTVEITFQVDMSNEDVSPLGIHIAGDFQGWDPAGTPMQEIGDDVYAVTVELGTGNYHEYKFINGNAWGMDETVPPECAIGWSRFILVPDVVTTLDVVCFGSCDPCPIPITNPTVSTAFTTNITSTSATSGGNVTYDGGTLVTARGVVWSTTPNPTLVENEGFTEDGEGLGEFVSEISGLQPETTYYVRAYAENSEGVSYGEELSFSTTEWHCGDVIFDIDGNSYNTVLIGDQCWMRENLKSTKDANGNTISRVCYQGNEVNCNIYGGLYTWGVVMNGENSSNSNPSGVLGICPSGWHVPSNAEWSQLINKLGGSDYAGGYMKEVGTTHWYSPNTGATNSSGFTALPGGWYLSGGSNGLGFYGRWWSSTSVYTSEAFNIRLYYNYRYVYQHYSSRSLRYSVRCLKD